MAKAKMKTTQNRNSPAKFVKSVEHPVRRADAQTLLKWFTEITGMPAKMWGPSIIGYGRYHYKYETGREGEFLMTGFSPRKANLVIYIMPGYREQDAALAKLGKHKIGKSCLYINKLADVDLDVLAGMVKDGVDYMRKNYDTWDV